MNVRLSRGRFRRFRGRPFDLLRHRLTWAFVVVGVAGGWDGWGGADENGKRRGWLGGRAA
jgi:hypothetical protein